MSHFTNMKTRFQNLFYLEKALSRLNIQYEKQKKDLNISNSELYSTNLVIAQPNGYDINFCWNGQEYELIVDRDFWQQSCSINTFVDQIAQKYAGEVIIGESQKIGFQPVNYKQNIDNSNTLILQRYKLY